MSNEEAYHKEIPGPDVFIGEFYWTFKEFPPILHKFFQNKIKGTLSTNSLLWSHYYPDTKTTNQYPLSV